MRARHEDRPPCFHRDRPVRRSRTQLPPRVGEHPQEILGTDVHRTASHVGEGLPFRHSEIDDITGDIVAVTTRASPPEGPVAPRREQAENSRMGEILVKGIATPVEVLTVVWR